MAENFGRAQAAYDNATGYVEKTYDTPLEKLLDSPRRMLLEAVEYLLPSYDRAREYFERLDDEALRVIIADCVDVQQLLVNLQAKISRPSYDVVLDIADSCSWEDFWE